MHVIAHKTKDGVPLPVTDPNQSINVLPGPFCPPGNAPKMYLVVLNPTRADDRGKEKIELPFHYKYPPEPVKPLDPPYVMGLTNEVLLAVVADRLECFQRGPFACEYNQIALGHIRSALNFLQTRSLERAALGKGPTEK